VGGSVRALLRVLTMGSVVGRVTGRSIGVLVVKEGPSYFEPLADFCVAGSVRIPIDRSFALDELPAALARVGEGRACGKVVVVPSLMRFERLQVLRTRLIPQVVRVLLLSPTASAHHAIANPGSSRLLAIGRQGRPAGVAS
jgi:hypothetical protein